MKIVGLIVTHGLLGEALIKECKRIIVDCDDLKSLSTHQLSARDITRLVEGIILSEPAIVFTDSPGTAPAIRSQLALKKNQFEVTGVNLPMLLSFLVHKDNLDVETLANKMVEDGKRSLSVVGSLKEENDKN